MSAAALESPARSLRCSEGVIGRLLFLSPPLPSLPLLPWIFSSSGPADSFFFSHPFREPSHAWQVQEKRETAEVYGEEEEGKETEGRDTGEGLQTTEGDRRQKEGARPIAEQLPAFHFISWHFYGGSFSSKTVMYKKKIEVLIVSYIAKCTRRSEMLPPLFWFFGFRNLVAVILLPFSYRALMSLGADVGSDKVCSSSTPKVVGSGWESSSNSETEPCTQCRNWKFCHKVGHDGGDFSRMASKKQLHWLQKGLLYKLMRK